MALPTWSILAAISWHRRSLSHVNNFLYLISRRPFWLFCRFWVKREKCIGFTTTVPLLYFFLFWRVSVNNFSTGSIWLSSCCCIGSYFNFSLLFPLYNGGKTGIFYATTVFVICDFYFNSIKIKIYVLVEAWKYHIL